MAGKPFDPTTAVAGAMLSGIDPLSLMSGQRWLARSQVETQRRLIREGITRWTPITVPLDGIVYVGNHGVRAAAEEGVPVDVLVTSQPGNQFGSIMEVPIDEDR